jgi:hypothetical protein
MSEIAHADQLTRTEFVKLLKQRKTQLMILAGAVLAGIVCVYYISPLGGLIAAVLMLLVGVGITWAVADHKAEEAFYDSYAESRGLTRSEADLGEDTPLLKKGDERKTDEMFKGPLNDRFDGSLSLYTYTEVTHDHKGNRYERNYPFTIVSIEMQDVYRHMAELVVEERSGFKVFDKLEDAFRGKLKRLKLESQALDERFEIFVRENQDPVWMRRLFSPSFIVWLTEHPEKDLAFEFGNANLHVYIPKHKKTAAEFDSIIAVGCELAGKLRAEAAESE